MPSLAIIYSYKDFKKDEASPVFPFNKSVKKYAILVIFILPLTSWWRPFGIIKKGRKNYKKNETGIYLPKP
jgi:hypothetical protein